MRRGFPLCRFGRVVWAVSVHCCRIVRIVQSVVCVCVTKNMKTTTILKERSECIETIEIVIHDARIDVTSQAIVYCQKM